MFSVWKSGPSTWGHLGSETHEVPVLCPLKSERHLTLAGGDLLCPLSLRCALELSCPVQLEAFLTAEGTGGPVRESPSRGVGTLHQAPLGLAHSVAFHSWRTRAGSLEVWLYQAATGFSE